MSPRLPPLQRLIEKSSGFTLSPAQLALIALGTGQPLAKQPQAVQDAAADALGYEGGPDKPVKTLLAVCGSRSGKTYLSAALAVHRALSVSLETLAPGEECKVLFASASMRQARACLAYSKGLIRSLGLARTIGSERRDSFSIRRGGKLIEFAVVRGVADSFAGAWLAAVVLNELAISVDPAQGTPLELEEVERAIRVRLLPSHKGAPGGLLIGETTAGTSASGPVYERVQSCHGQPNAGTCVFVAGTLTMRPDDPGLAEIVADEETKDPLNSAREHRCEWVSAGANAGAVFGDDLLQLCLCDCPSNMEPQPDLPSWAGIDLGFTSDGSGLAIIRRRADGIFELCSLRRWKPKRNAPLQPSTVIGEALDEMQRHGTRLVWSDTHHWASLLEHAQHRRGLHPKKAPAGAVGKAQAHTDAQELIASGNVVIGHDAALVRALRGVTAIREPSGAMRIRSARRRGDHGDLASALVLALHGAHRRGGRGADPLPRAGRVSTGLQRLGLVDGQGRSTTSAQQAFEVDSNSRGVRHTTGHAGNQFATRATFRDGSGGF